MKPVLVIDNYDSFVYNLVHMIRAITGIDPVVKRNDAMSVGEAAMFDRILLSPGPGIPEEAGVMPRIVRELGSSKQILGVCLGHQCIGEVYGGRLTNMTEVCHGRGIATELLDPEEVLFRGISSPTVTGRYHSWMVSREDLPDSLRITATDSEGRIMGLRHVQYDVRGVQFHPESVLTEDGAQMMQNWLGREVSHG